MARHRSKLRLEALESRITPVGNLDPAFGVGGGVAVTDVSPTGQGDVISEVVVLDGGKILTVGTAFGTAGSGFRPAFARYEADGSLDLTFGTNGFAYDPQGFSDVADVAVQEDGKIVVAGPLSGPGTLDFGVARYHPNGTRDLSFGINGFARANIGGNRDIATSVEIQADGKIVVAGHSAPDGTANFQAAVARFNPNGTLDTGFANLGTFRAAFTTRTQALDLAVRESDGAILLAGSIFQAGTGDDFLVLQFDSAGNPDLSFGSGGFAAFHLGGGDTAREIVLLPDGNLVVAGTATLNVGLARLLPDGSLDGSFGTGGIVVENVAATLGATGATVADLELQFDGKLVLVGTSDTAVTAPDNFYLLRYEPNGNLDVSFGSGGATVSDFFGSQDIARAAALDGAGGILAAGSTFVPGGSGTDSVLARYVTNRAPAAADDTATTPQGQAATVAVLANDTDADGHALSVVAVTQPAGGVVAVNPDGTVTYTPGQYFSGTDEFTYTVSDGELLATATVRITVEPAPGPKVVQAAGVRVGGVTLVLVTFSEAVDPSSFDASDLVVRDRQGRLVRIGSASVVALDGRTFLITFEDPTPAHFSLEIGPDVRSAETGQMMNQDNDGENGEAEDAFVLGFDRFGGEFLG